MKNFVVGVFVLILMVDSLIQPAAAQNRPVQCGDIIESEFQENNQQINYQIQLQPGDILRVQGRTISRSLGFRIFVYGPTGLTISESGRGSRESNDFSTPYVNTDTLPARGIYTIQLSNYNWWRDSMGVGILTIEVSCTLYDGTVIEPGSVIQSSTQPPSSPPQPVALGYTGIAPIDFSGVGLTSFDSRLFGVPVTSSIPASGNGVSGFRLDASADDVLEISARRTAGNLPVGFVIFAEPNIPLFVAGPVSATSFSTQVTLPQDGSYVIGLFRMGESPAGAQDTQFQITVNLNP